MVKTRKKRRAAAESTGDETTRLSKHEMRRLRRTKYYQMIDCELSQERHFKGRVVDTLNRDGVDIAHDGRPIKGNWWEYMQSRFRSDRNSSEACLYLLEQTYRGLQPARV